MVKPTATLTLREIRRAIKSERGAMAEVARKLGVDKTTVSLVLRGKSTSKRILEAARERALEILEAQKAAA